MFLGHLAVGFAAKRAAPRTGLAPLMAAPLLLDLVWPVLVLLGVEEVRLEPGATAVTPLDFASYPFSHGLAFAALWAALLAVAWVSLAQWFWVPWAWFIDRHRALREGALGALAA